MGQHPVIAGASFGPEALKTIGRAFDEAWSAIKPRIGRNQMAIEAARLSLADVVLSLANDEIRDWEPLKREALRVFEHQHRRAS